MRSNIYHPAALLLQTCYKQVLGMEMVRPMKKIASVRIESRAVLVQRFLLIVFALVAIIGISRSGGAVAQTSPDGVVKSLYTAHKNGRGNIFTKQSKEILHKFFDQKLADLIWKELNHQPEDEVGNLDFDPLYNAQDIQISKFKIGKPKVAGNKATVLVTFDNGGRHNLLTFPLIKTGAGWKIQNINYEDGSTLIKILSAPHT